MQKYWSNIFQAISTALTGMKITAGHIFKKSLTLKYPYEKDDIPKNSRMKLEMTYDDCIGCKQCARACPIDCIDITTTKALPEDNLAATKNGTARKMLTTSFIIDFSECMYCGLCVYPCPEDCITMTPNYEFGTYDKDDLITDYSPLSDEEQEKRLKVAEDLKAKQMAAKEKAAEEAKAKLEAEAKIETKTEKKPEAPRSLGEVEETL